MSLPAAALLISVVACLINTACLTANVRRYHRLTGKWLPW